MAKETPVYAYRKGFDNHFYESFSEAIELIIDSYHPEYERAKDVKVFECEVKQIMPHVDADTIIEDIDNNIDHEEMPEGECWSDNLSEEGRKKLQEFLDGWLPEMEREVWVPQELMIDVDWDAEIAKYKATHLTPVTE